MKDNTKDLKEYFDCDCGDSAHHFTITQVSNYDKTFDDECVYISYYMNQYRTWYQRLWLAIKYVFGYKSRFGDWDSITLDKEKVLRLRNFCDKALENIENRTV